MKRVLMVFLGFLTVPAHGQFALPPDSGSARLVVRANIDSALVILDGVLIGTTPFTTGGLSPGIHHLRILHPDLENWNAPVIIDSVDLPSGGQLEKQFWFERQYVLQTYPSGAEVILGNRVVGLTPLTVRPAQGDSVVVVRKRGYRAASVPFAVADRGHLWVNLSRDPGMEIDDQAMLTVQDEPSVLPLVLSGVSSVVAGGFSAYFKVQADQAYGQYLLSGDPGKLAETRKLDSVAGIALAASQIYFALFSYLLIAQ